MKMFNQLLDRFRDGLEADIEEANSLVKQKKKSEMEKARKQAEKMREKVEKDIDSLRETLLEYEDYEDSKDRKVIEDVMNNIVSERLEKIEGFSASNDMEELHDQLDSFITEFQMMSKKEAAVMSEAYAQSDITSELDKLRARKDEIRGFIEGAYSVVTNQRTVEQLLEEREELQNELAKLRKEHENLETDEIKNELEQKRNERSEIRKSSEWQEYEELEERLEDLKKEKKELKHEIGKAMSQTERGLKKLIYRAENTDISLKNVKLLKKIRDNDKKAVLNTRPEKVEKSIAEAVEKLPDEILDERQRNKLSEGAETLKDFTEYKEKIKDIEKEMKETKKEIDKHPVLQREEEIEKRIEELEKTVKRREEEQEKLEELISSKKEEIREIEDQIEEILDSTFRREVSLNT